MVIRTARLAIGRFVIAVIEQAIGTGLMGVIGTMSLASSPRIN